MLKFFVNFFVKFCVNFFATFCCEILLWNFVVKFCVNFFLWNFSWIFLWNFFWTFLWNCSWNVLWNVVWNLRLSFFVKFYVKNMFSLPSSVGRHWFVSAIKLLLISKWHCFLDLHPSSSPTKMPDQRRSSNPQES